MQHALNRFRAAERIFAPTDSSASRGADAVPRAGLGEDSFLMVHCARRASFLGPHDRAELGG